MGKETQFERAMRRIANLKRGYNYCILWDGKLKANKYAAVFNGTRWTYVHRMALQHFLGRDIAPRMQAIHQCHNKACFNPTHLYEGRPLDNAMDRKALGAYCAISQNKRKKLTTQERELILKRATADERHKDIARDFGVSIFTISRIKNGPTSI